MSNSRLTFWDGVGSVRRGFGWLLSSPRVWLYALWPVGIWALLSSVAIWASLFWIRVWAEGWFAAPVDFWSRTLAVSVSWLIGVLAMIVGLFVAWALTPPFSSPALEKIVRERERALGAAPRAEVGFFAGLWLGIRAQVTLLFCVVPFLFVLWFVGWLVPLLMLVTVPMKVLITVVAVALGLLDYPLTLRGMPMRERWQLLQSNTAAVLGFGAVFAALFWVPFAPIFLLPVGAAGAAELCVRLLSTSPRPGS